jgi:hypothetical protein
MNPWRTNIFLLMRNMVRLVIWTFIAVNGLILLFYLTLFTFEICQHTWSYLERVWFASDW